MRVAVISDIHANLAALEATLSALEDERPDATWCLGGLIGNHDLGVLEEIALDEFSFEAAASARWTQGVLDERARDYLAGLSPAAEIPDVGAELYHASPRDP